MPPNFRERILPIRGPSPAESPDVESPPGGCESCGAGPLEKFAVPGVAEMWHCPRCDLYQKGQVAVAETYGLSYHRSYATKYRRKLRTAAIRLSRLAGTLDVEKPRLLDIGCSLGWTVEAAQRLGWEAHGVDVSGDAVDFCHRRGLHCRVVSDPELPYADGMFDALTAWHVIEHVHDVTKTLREWRRVLQPGGVLALETPDASCLKVRLQGASYRHFWKPEHVYVFRPENLAALLESAGFEVLRPPRLGRIGQLPPMLALYGVGHQVLDGLKSLTALGKAFQLFCRRVPAARIAAPLRRAA